MQDHERLKTNDEPKETSGQEHNNGPATGLLEGVAKPEESSIKEEKDGPKSQHHALKEEKENLKEEKEERLYQQRAALAHAKAVTAQRLEQAFIGFEEILRILHSTNWKNQPQVKKNMAEIELICKNALLELKGL